MRLIDVLRSTWKRPPPERRSPTALSMTQIEERIRSWGAGSFAMADVVDSTALLNELGPREYGVQVGAFRQRASTIAESAGGFLVDATGDAILALFEGLAKAISFAEQLTSDSGAPSFALRIAVHHERPVSDLRDSLTVATMLAPEIPYVARILSALKEPGIGISDSAHKQLIASGITGLKVGTPSEHEFKGFPGRHMVWRVARWPDA